MTMVPRGFRLAVERSAQAEIDQYQRLRKRHVARQPDDVGRRNAWYCHGVCALVEAMTHSAQQPWKHQRHHAVAGA